RHKPGWVSHRQIAGITDQGSKTTRLRRMIGKMSPNIVIAVKPAGTFDTRGERPDDPGLDLLHLQSSAVMIRQGLVPQTIDGLPVLSRLDDVPAGVAQNPRHVIVLIGSPPVRQRVGNTRPYAPRQPFALTPCQRRKQIIDPLLLSPKPGP